MGGSTINTNSTERTKSIQTAMNILNEAIKESRNDVREVLERDYEQLRQSLSAIKPEVKAALKEIGDASMERLQEARRTVVKKSTDAAHFVDESAHQKPWIFIASAAAIFAVIGFLFGRKSK
ncbi:MAG: DUF883 family protein [Bdellovibrionales bacterium]|nr:DUF883 family protein [Bdellovibrionales bacterium]